MSEVITETKKSAASTAALVVELSNLDVAGARANKYIASLAQSIFNLSKGEFNLDYNPKAKENKGQSSDFYSNIISQLDSKKAELIGQLDSKKAEKAEAKKAELKTTPPKLNFGGELKKSFGGMMGGIGALTASTLALAIIQKPIGALLGGLLEPLEPLTDLFGMVGEVIGLLLIPVVKSVMGILLPFMPLLVSIVTSLMPIINFLLMPLNIIGMLLAISIPIITTLFQFIGKMTGSLDVINVVIMNVIGTFVGIIGNIIGFFTNLISNFGTIISTFATNFINNVVNFFNGIILSIGIFGVQLMSNFSLAITNFINNIWNTITTFAANFVNDIKEGIRSVIDTIIDPIDDLIDAIQFWK